MAQKRKTNHSKTLADIEKILTDIEAKTAKQVKRSLGASWRDNLFEIMMTRMDLAAPHKKTFAAVPSLLRDEPKKAPHFARRFGRTMKNILMLAKAPAQPHHVVAFSVLYVSVIDTYLKDETRDHSKTMAALDKRLGLFQQFIEFSRCR